MTMQEASHEELQNKTWESDEGQAQNKEVIKEEDYKNLQSSYTKANQERIDLALKLAEKDKSSILDIKDRKLQEKIVKEIYWLNNIDEVKVIHWDKFYEEKSNDYNDNEDEDKMSKLEKELKLLKYSQTKWEIDNSIEEYKKSNPLAFESEEAEDKLREELSYISDTLPIKERVRRAGSIAFWVNNNSADSAYLDLKEKWAYVKGDENNKAPDKIKTKNSEELENIFSSVLSYSKKKKDYTSKFNW